MAELKYSKKGTPYIELTDEAGDTYGTFIFSTLTSTDAGYKYVVFTHRYTNQVVTKKGKGDKSTHTFTEIAVNDSSVFNLKMKRSEDGIKGVPQGMLPRRLVDWMIVLFDEFTVDGVIPHSAIKLMEPIVADLNIDEVLVTVVERVRKAKAKARLEKKMAKLDAQERAKMEEKIMQDDFRENNGIDREAKSMTTVDLSEVF